MNAEKIFTLGTAIKITTILSLNNPNSVKITIKDDSGVVKTNEVSMTGDTPNVFSYIYQSLEEDSEGEYEVTIKATYGSYVALSKQYFTLEE
jgi:LEA14-like dessication related protein